MLNHLNAIEKIKGRKDKEAYLAEMSEEDAAVFKKVADLCYGKCYRFGITKDTLPSSNLVRESEYKVKLSLALSELETHGLGEGFGNLEKLQKLLNIMSALSPDNQEVVRRILKGNLGCGIAAGSVNKVWPNCIFVPPYMRCNTLNTKYFEKLKPPYIAQTKLDGKFVNVIFDTVNRRVEFRSRDWVDSTERYLTDEHCIAVNKLASMDVVPFVLHGEIRVLGDDGKILPRDEGNGYLNSDEIDTSRIVYNFWDMVPLEDFFNLTCDQPYAVRLSSLEDMMKIDEVKKAGFMLTDIELFNTKQEIVDFMKTALLKGEEGIVVKDPEAIWKHGTSNGQLKGKIAVDCDLKIIGYELSNETKYAGQIASIIVSSSCGKLICNVGGGLKDKDRVDIEKFDRYVEEGKIVAVRYNDVVENELRPGLKSLYLQRIIEFRDDKTDADSLEKVIENLTTYEFVL